jgi:hypothetical protein
VTIERTKSGNTRARIEHLLAKIRYRAGVKNDPQTFGEADRAIWLLWNHDVELQIEKEAAIPQH